MAKGLLEIVPLFCNLDERVALIIGITTSVIDYVESCTELKDGDYTQFIVVSRWTVTTIDGSVGRREEHVLIDKYIWYDLYEFDSYWRVASSHHSFSFHDFALY